MDLHNKVEQFLSKGEFLFLETVGGTVSLTLFFTEKEYEIFKDRSNYENLNRFFDNRNMTLRIIQMPYYYRGSLIDTETGDTLNINGVRFEHNSLDFFINHVPKDHPIFFAINASIKHQGEMTRIMQPIVPNSKPLILLGYSCIYDK